MQYIDPAQANLLYEDVVQIVRSEGLTERERIPKYRAVLEALFRLLTGDEKHINHSA